MFKWEALKCTVGVECFLYTVYHTHTSTIYIHDTGQLVVQYYFQQPDSTFL